MDPIHIRSMLAMDVVQSHAIVKDFLLLITEMTEPIPLTGRLRIECPNIVVHNSRWFLINVLVKELTTEERCFLSVKRPVEGNSLRKILEI